MKTLISCSHSFLCIAAGLGLSGFITVTNAQSPVETKHGPSGKQVTPSNTDPRSSDAVKRAEQKAINQTPRPQGTNAGNSPPASNPSAARETKGLIYPKKEQSRTAN